MKTYKYSAKNLTEDRLVSNWTTEYSVETLPKLIGKLCKEVDSSFSQKVSMILAENNDNLLLEIAINPDDYTDYEVYLKDSMILGLIKKYPFWNVTVDPKLNAIKKFIAAESSCKRTNRYFFGGFHRRKPVLASILHDASRIIAKILGDAPTIEDLSFKFGPGANYSVKNNTTALDKLRSPLDVTANAQELAKKYLASCPGWMSCHFDEISVDSISRVLSEIPGDRLSFVPKDAKTLRPIAIGGLLNTLMQKSIGKSIRNKLKPYLDLRNTQSFHKTLAKQSSENAQFATVDLSSASDTISYAVIMDLFPQDWFDLMDGSRSDTYIYENKSYSYEKFSAMGNGYTFEMETLLFYSLSKAVCNYLNLKDLVSVYGDDIIIPTQAYDLLVEVLSDCGFETNNEKSFNTGYFRESCGGDYFNGYDVRPFYLKDKISYRTLFLMHNFYIRHGYNYLLPKTFLFIRKLIGKEICNKMRGNLIENDGYLLDLQCSDLPSSVVFEIPQTRKIPNYLSFNVLKALGLYRQQEVSYDMNLSNINFITGNISIRLYRSFYKKPFYIGTTDMKGKLPKNTYEKRYKLKSTTDIRKFYS